MWPHLNKPKENTTLLSCPCDTQSLKERKASKALKGSGGVKVKLPSLWGLTQHEPFYYDLYKTHGYIVNAQCETYGVFICCGWGRNPVFESSIHPGGEALMPTTL